MTTSYKVARRSFLRSCSASALLLPLLRNIEASAQGIKAPLRFLVIHHPLGTQLSGPDMWRPNAAATTTNFTLPANSAPFNPLKSQMVMIDGLNIVAANRTGGYAGDKTHEGGMVALMTGQPTLGLVPGSQQDHVSGGASIDQIFLDRSPLLGGPNFANPTTVHSLQLAADIRSDRDEVSPRTLSYRPTTTNTNIAAARQPLAPVTDPLTAFRSIFGQGTPTDMTGAQLAATLAQKKSVLDFMRSDLQRLRSIVPAAEKGKLDFHADAIQQLEANIQKTLMPPTTGLVCVTPTQPPSVTLTGTDGAGPVLNGVSQGASALHGADYYVPNVADGCSPLSQTCHPHQLIGETQLNLIRTAFACDYTRVATFMWSAGTNWVTFPTSFQGQHLGGTPGQAPSSAHHPPSHVTDAATVGWLAAIDQWYANETSKALQQFAATPDIDGGNLLDNTVVVYVTEVSRAYDHDFRNVPYLVFGGKNTGIQGGQFLKVTGGPLTKIDSDGVGTGNRPTNDVWLALAPVFGITDLTALGAATGAQRQFTGPLPGLVV